MGDQMALPAGFTFRVFGTADRDDVRASVASFGYESAGAGSAEMRFGALPLALDALLSSVTTDRYLVPSYVTRRVYITQQDPIAARLAAGESLDARVAFPADFALPADFDDASSDDLFEVAREASSVMDALQRIRDDPDGAWFPVNPAADDARAFRRDDPEPARFVEPRAEPFPFPDVGPERPEPPRHRARYPGAFPDAGRLVLAASSVCFVAAVVWLSFAAMTTCATWWSRRFFGLGGTGARGCGEDAPLTVREVSHATPLLYDYEDRVGAVRDRPMRNLASGDSEEELLVLVPVGPEPRM
jgi:hypothetical protein